MLLRSATARERVGSALSPAFSGVIIAEARKELIAPIGKPAKARRCAISWRSAAARG